MTAEELRIEFFEELVNNKIPVESDISYDECLSIAEWFLSKIGANPKTEPFTCPCCGRDDRTYKTEAYHCNHCSTTTEI